MSKAPAKKDSIVIFYIAFFPLTFDEPTPFSKTAFILSLKTKLPLPPNPLYWKQSSLHSSPLWSSPMYLSKSVIPRYTVSSAEFSHKLVQVTCQFEVFFSYYNNYFKIILYIRFNHSHFPSKILLSEINQYRVLLILKNAREMINSDRLIQLYPRT